MKTSKTYVVGAKTMAETGPQLFLGPYELDAEDKIILPAKGFWEDVTSFAKFDIGQTVRFDKDGVLVHHARPRRPKKNKKNKKVA